jgi:3-methyladenine DNA glycosylase/8-oxoguanine DNA glycosylase
MTRSPHDLALRKDPVMRRVIDAVGPQPSYYRERTDFETACRIIVGQQLSYAADQLRTLGLSRSKATFIQELATRTDSGDLDFRRIRKLDDIAAGEALRGIKGFGPWSVEMFLIFAIGRDDVFSIGDAGLRRAVCDLYGVPPAEYEARIDAIADHWRPYRSHACRYLWGWLEYSSSKAPETVERGLTAARVPRR